VETWAARIEEGIPRKPSYPVFYPVPDGEPDLEERIASGKRVDAEIVHYPPPIDHYSIIIEAADDYLGWMREQLAASAG
jgi:hypothetical protein